ncbi:MAG TPA: hypothetical protein VG966_10555 [Hyphomicrobiaceae bacterium]|jgi:hypothetical protein|nr:hypothetical protein [Hyphomicrobiaceae bacterium]
MMSRAEKTRRIARVQQQMQRAEEWRLGDLQRRRSRVEADEREVLAALGEENALHGLFLDTMARRLHALAQEAARLRDEEKAQIRRLLAATGKLKVAERLAATAAEEARREEDKKQLADIIDETVARKDASLR